VSKSRIHNGVKHGARCKCPLYCDPNETALKAAREAAALARKLQREGAIVPIEPVRFMPIRRARPIAPSSDPSALRFRELLKQGVSAARAMAIVDAESKGTP